MIAALRQSILYVPIALLTFTYDADGNLLTAANNAGTNTYMYDALDRLATSKDMFSQTLTYTYDAAGNTVQVQDSQGGITTSVYNADNELVTREQTGQATLDVQFTYNADGEIVTETRYSDLGSTVIGTTDYTYDTDDRVTNILSRDGSNNIIANYTYTYDVDSRLTTETDNGTVQTYTYDQTSQLTSDNSTDYSYDANGNRTMSGYVTGPDNQLLNDGTWAYTYDNAGNEVSKTNDSTGEVWTYGYDNLNQLTSAVDKDSHGNLLAQVTYVYDAQGNRIEEDAWTSTSGTTTVTRFAYDGQNIWADLNGSNALLTRRMYGDGTNQIIDRVSSGGTVAWFLQARLGTVTDLTDDTGALLDHITYDAYGNITSQSDPSVAPRYGFDGEQFDSITGLQYNDARYYDPSTGNWISQDPLGFAAGDSNLYRYVANDPTNGIDPTGLADQIPPVQLKDKSNTLVATMSASIQGQTIFGKVIAAIPKNDEQLTMAAKALGGDHFNWYQVVVATDKGRVQYSAKDPADLLKPPFVDQPPGGFSGIVEKGKNAIWADDLPWYYGEVMPPAGNTLPYPKDISQQTFKGFLGFTDSPKYPKDGSYAVFKTWLVLLDDHAGLVKFLNGFQWKATQKGGTTVLSDLTPLAPLMPGSADYANYFQKLTGPGSGFRLKK